MFPNTYRHHHSEIIFIFTKFCSSLDWYFACFFVNFSLSLLIKVLLIKKHVTRKILTMWIFLCQISLLDWDYFNDVNFSEIFMVLNFPEFTTRKYLIVTFRAINLDTFRWINHLQSLTRYYWSDAELSSHNFIISMLISLIS